MRLDRRGAGRLVAVAGIGLLTIAWLGAAACGARERPELARVTAQDRIEMRRGPCFGTCPIYTVEVAGDGSVRFIGERWVEATGEHRAEIEPADAAGLFVWADSMGFFEMPADITPGDEAVCGGAWTDMPSAEITIRRAGRVHTVNHYHGCPKAPESLTRFEERIDAVLGVERWVGRP